MALVNYMYQLRRDRALFSPSIMFSPPSELQNHVIPFEATIGCNYNGCTYCEGYRDIRYHAKSVEEYQQHVREVWSRIGERSYLARNLTRIFIGGGNALSINEKTLNSFLRFTKDMFWQYTGHFPARIAIYGRTNDILKCDLNSLRNIDLIYWGVESGSNDVLEYVNKGCTCENMIKAGRRIENAGITASVMVMPGLGGVKYYRQHIEGTASVLSEIRPRYITFMGVNAGPHTAYTKTMQQELSSGTNRPLTPRETAQQMTDIIRKLDPFRTKIGCFDKDIDAVGRNPLTFGSYEIDSRDKKRLLALKLQLKTTFGLLRYRL